MNRKLEAALKASLTETLDKWVNTETGKDDRDSMGWISSNVSELMASAALAVLTAQIDLNEYLKTEGQLTDD